MELALDVARSSSGGAIADELGLPVFLYGASADGLRPAFFRRGGPDELQRRLDSGEVRPDFGPARLDPRAGGVLVGARPLLIAFNVALRDRRPGGRSGDRGGGARVERRHDAASRRSGSCFPASGRVQVSLNVVDVEQARLADVVGARPRGRG